MAKVAAGSTTSNYGKVAGKRLGVKKFAGEQVKAGNVIVRQRGSVYHPGDNTYMGKTHAIHAKTDGVVQFRKMSGFKRGRFFVDVIV
ncbi:MAG: 50S ribosomal protein L27 [Candidatus Dojkabacteria bacterium]|jgi:large subunit ribosomal protein L27